MRISTVVFITASTLDDLLRNVYKKLLKKGKLITPSRGEAIELTGVLLELTNPRARISRTETRGRMFSCLGELLWYLSGSDSLEPISYYLKQYNDESDDGKTVYGGYGPRLLAKDGHINQLDNVKTLLKRNANSRRAVIQLYDAKDIDEKRKTIPCTCTMQFFIRGGCLDMSVTMRSNDAFYGLAHDVFAFSMLQEIMARSLRVKVGKYKHYVGSLHLYRDKSKLAETYLNEGWQSEIAMPRMPDGDPSASIKLLLKAEKEIRLTGLCNDDISTLDNYWADLIRLLLIYSSYARKDKASIEKIKGEMKSSVYLAFIEQRHRQLEPISQESPEQLEFSNTSPKE